MQFEAHLEGFMRDDFNGSYYMKDGSPVLRYWMLSGAPEWVDSLSGVPEKIDI